jgi:hypothetical protein
MADNVTLDAGAGGDTLGADDIGSVKYQRVKLIQGADGTNDGDVSAAAPLSVKWGKLEVVAGNVTNYSANRKFGANLVVGTTEEDIWTNGGTYPWPTAAETVRVRAGGNANDTSAGSGARTVTVEGLNGSGTEISEDLTLAGASASSATSATFMRVNRVFVATMGTYGDANAGTITIENTSSTNILATIETGIGQTQQTHYTVPASKTAYLMHITANVPSAKAVDLKMWQRLDFDDTSAPVGAKRLVTRIDALETSYEEDIGGFTSFAAKTDLWWTGKVDTGTGEADVTYSFVLID